MKESLEIRGTVEFSKKELLDIINSHLEKTKNLKTRRIQYTPAMETILCEVYQSSDNRLKMIGDETKVKRTGRDGYKKRFMGFFATARQIFEEIQKKGKKEISLIDFVDEIHFHYPNMEPNRIAQYLHDRRQLPGVNYIGSKRLIRIS